MLVTTPNKTCGFAIKLYELETAAIGTFSFAGSAGVVLACRSVAHIQAVVPLYET